MKYRYRIVRVEQGETTYYTVQFRGDFLSWLFGQKWITLIDPLSRSEKRFFNFLEAQKHIENLRKALDKKIETPVQYFK